MKKQNVKTKYVLNLNDKMVDSLIQKVENSIIEQKSKQAVIQPELDEAKALYDEVKAKYDVFQEVIDEEEHTLEALVRFKKGDCSKTLQVYSNISNTNQKVRHAPIKWVKECQKYLEANPEFVKPLDLLVRISKTIEHIRQRNFTESQLKSTMYYILDLTRKGKSPFSIKNDKIGLKQWLGADGIVNVDHVKEFMFS